MNTQYSVVSVSRDKVVADTSSNANTMVRTRKTQWRKHSCLYMATAIQQQTIRDFRLVICRYLVYDTQNRTYHQNEKYRMDGIYNFQMNSVRCTNPLTVPMPIQLLYGSRHLKSLKSMC